MKLTTKQLQRIIREELSNLSEIGVGGYEFDGTAEGGLPDRFDIVNDLIDAMSAAGKEWLAMATKGQTPEAAAKYQEAYDIIEDALIKSAQSPLAHEKQVPGAYDAMKESKSKKRKTRRKRR